MREINIYELNQDEYKCLYDFTYDFLVSVSQSLNIPVAELIWTDIKSYCIDKLGYKIFPYKFNSELKNCLAGTTYVCKGIIQISYNPEIEPIGRSNFSQCHEISHAIKHIGENKNRDVEFKLMDIIDEQTNSKRPLIETEADIIASILMMNNDALIKEFQSKYTTIDSLMDKFGASFKCVQVRLKQLLYYNLNIQPKYIDRIVQLFCQNEPIFNYIFFHMKDYCEYCSYDDSVNFFNYIENRDLLHLSGLKNFADFTAKNYQYMIV